MTRPNVTYPRADSAVVAELASAISSTECTVGATLPADWTPGSLPHIQVLIDGTPIVQHPVAIAPTVRLVAWASSPTLAHTWAMHAHGHVLAYEGDEFAAFPLTGPLPAVDPDHQNAALCSCTVRVRVRSVDNT